MYRWYTRCRCISEIGSQRLEYVRCAICIDLMNVYPCNLFFSSRGRIKFYTHPPEQQSLPSHLSADIVKSWSVAFDMSTLQEEETKDLSGKYSVRVCVCVCVRLDAILRVFTYD